MIKAVIFDLDGTLLDRDASVKSFIRSQYNRKLAGQLPKDNYISRFIELDNRGYMWKDKVYQQLVKEFEIKLTWEELLQDYLSAFKYHCIPFPNLINMISELNRLNISLGIITNGMGQFQMDNIEALEINDCFNTIVISEWEGIKKPDPQIFLRTLERLGVSPEEAIFVGDHPENDVKAAQKVGMKAIWKWDAQWDKVETDYIVHDLTEIPNIISEM